ncbi:MAG: hypothetical protein ABI355_18035 [Solirubrobacteraceae bacterium]
MPSFCRHNHLVQNCPICSREQHVELRPVVTGGTRAEATPAPPRSPSPARSGGAGGRTRPGVTVRRMARGADDGFHSQLVPGLRSSADAERLALELAWAAMRLDVLASDPPGLYAEVADASGDPEQRTWLAFLIAYLGPLAGAEPFAEIERVRVAWPPDALPELAQAQPGERTSLEAGRADRTLAAYRSWAARSGSQATGLNGDEAWTPERRFARAYERLGLPGLERGSRFDLLVTLGHTGVYELRAATLALGGSDSVTVAAKRVLGIGDPILLERRAIDLARACELPLEALDVGLFNWERGARAMLGMPVGLEGDPGRADAARSALGV